MSILRIYSSLRAEAQHCQWAVIGTGQAPVAGEGRLADLPQSVESVQLVIPAAQVLITHARLPQGARRGTGSVLAFAVEEQTVSDPDANQVSWLGTIGEEDALAVVDKRSLAHWQQTLNTAGIHIDEVHSETLLLPIRSGEWSINWNGSEGFCRTGELDGAATDSGDRKSPPLLLRLKLEEAKAHGAAPTSIALYMTTAAAVPDIAAWQRELGTDLRLEGLWDWRSALPEAGVCLAQPRQPWRIFSGAARRLRAAGWILGAAMILHALALMADWGALAGSQRALRQQMEAQFRATFPDTIAVVDPALQMRRKLASAHHAAGLPDNGDFLPMILQVAAATKELPAGSVRAISYAAGRMTVEVSPGDQATADRIKMRLLQSGLSVGSSPPPSRSANGKPVVALVVWSS